MLNESNLENYKLYLSNLSYNNLCNLYNSSDNDNVKYLVFQEVYKRNLPYFEKQYNVYLNRYKIFFLMTYIIGYNLNPSEITSEYTFEEILNDFEKPEEVYYNYLNFVDKYLKPYNLVKLFNKKELLSELEFIILEEISSMEHSSQYIHKRIDLLLSKIYRTYINKFKAIYYFDYNYNISDEEMFKFVFNEELRENILNRLNDLKPRESQVLSLRYGLEDGQIRNYEEMAKYFNVSKERIRQIEAKALRKLRNPKRSQCFNGILH